MAGPAKPPGSKTKAATGEGISNITGRKEIAARKRIAKIRKKYNKETGSFITIFKFCEYTGLKLENASGFPNK